MSIKFGDKIREIRRRNKLTLRELSERSEIELTYLSKLENNKTGVPEEKTIEKLVKALRVRTDEREDLFRLTKQIPTDWKNDLTENTKIFEIFRSAKGLSEAQLEEIQKEIERIKKSKDE